MEILPLFEFKLEVYFLINILKFLINHQLYSSF